MGIPTVVRRTPCALPPAALSDLTPLSGHARSVVTLEQVAGVFYIAMVVTLLLGRKAVRTRI